MKLFKFLFLVLFVCTMFSNALLAEDAEVHKVSPAITVDGLLDPAWEQVPANAIEIPYVNPDNIDDETDSYGEWKMLYDDSYLYLVVVVKDDSPWNDDDDVINGDDDGLDIMFDVDNGDEDSPEAEDDFMITIEYHYDGDCYYTGTKCCGFGEYFDEDMMAKCTDTADGFIIEAAMPMEDFPFDGTELFGFGIRLNDDDDGEGRDSQLSWFIEPGIHGWNKPADLGDVQFTDTVISNEETSVATSSLQTPAEFELSQNYPNPFNPTTSIDFTLPAQANVILTVYDISGQEIATLINGVRPAGLYSVSFDGATLSSGIYFYTLQNGSETLTNKMMLVK